MPLLNDGKSYAPTGHALKSWLLSGHAIATSKALFELSLYTGEILTDLLGEDSYFADAGRFWQAQEDAIATLAEDCRKAGWTDALIVHRGETFHHWEHVHCPKKKGGRVYIAVGLGGDV
ncbi:hypothetical protein U5A82_20730 [Sphingobium sp. CR2-8]|uniref:hypothetical protein n=1 Tax=Sphingobium sp. CR2-8 TaxID=1306534 RepID=UPI002DB8D838|nr:hypothetical protein [Sphingobium sp. CR2-8]MEC3912806.1 hypothetical protein [Sphingobium sp. CR2-8]